MAEVGLTGVPFLPITVKICGQEFLIDSSEAKLLESDLRFALLDLDQDWIEQMISAECVNVHEQPEDFNG